ncbi:sensor histidine kinase [Flavobacterium sp. WC2509]|uniref:sensor histidine kinase n=1 Tax=Flavobacterium sp. WC2509 TaxID=3461406 RepID=UPI0040443C37
MARKFLLYFILFIIGTVQAAPLKTYVYNNDFHHLSFYYEYLEDCNSFSTQEVIQNFKAGKFQHPTPDKAFSSGISTCSYWLALDVKNGSGKNQKMLWSFFNNGLSFSLYEFKNNKLVFIDQSSMHERLDERSFPVRSISFPFYLDNNQSKILFVKVTPTVNKNIYFPTTIKTVEEYLTDELEFSYLMGKYFGILLLTIFINLCLFVILKKKIYWYNIFYIFFIVLFQFSDFHFDSLEIPNAFFHFWSYINKDFYIALSIFFYVRVFQIFVELPKHFPKLNSILNYLNYILLLSAVLIFVSSILFHQSNYFSHFVNGLINVMIYVIIGFILVIIVIGIRFKIGFFMLFGLSFVFLFYGFLGYLLNTLNIANLPIFRPGNLINGSVIEVVLLTIFFVYKFKLDKEKAALKIITEIRKNDDLSKKMLTIESNEQERLARNIHDEIGSDITGLRLQLESHLLESNLSSEQQESILENVKTLYEKVRDLSYFMNPMEFNTNFIATIEDQVSFYRKNVKNVEFELFTNLKESDVFLPEIQSQLTRIIKEACTNALKHSLASKISIQLISENDLLLLMIEDNGIGFDTGNEFKSFGLENMKSRVAFLRGIITLESNKKGTSIIIEIPLV